MSNSNHIIMQQLLRWLGENQNSIIYEIERQKGSNTIWSQMDFANKFMRPADLKRLTNGFQLDLSVEDKFIVLFPVSKGGWSIPILTVSYDLNNEDQPVLRIRLALYCIDKETQQLRAIGFRFETPEWQREDAPTSSHLFYHAQFIKSFYKEEDRPKLPSVTWFSERQPSFRLNADNEIELFICTLISLYGLPEVNNMLKNSQIRDIKLVQELAERALKSW